MIGCAVEDGGGRSRLDLDLGLFFFCRGGFLGGRCGLLGCSFGSGCGLLGCSFGGGCFLGYGFRSRCGLLGGSFGGGRFLGYGFRSGGCFFGCSLLDRGLLSRRRFRNGRFGSRCRLGRGLGRSFRGRGLLGGFRSRFRSDGCVRFLRCFGRDRSRLLSRRRCGLLYSRLGFGRHLGRRRLGFRFRR